MEGQPEEYARQLVFSLTDPCHGLYMHRMDGKEHRGKKGSVDMESPKQAVEKGRVERLKKDVRGVVSRGRTAPQMVLDPEGCENNWIILRAAARVEPDLPKSVQGAKRRILGDIAIVIPDIARVQEGRVAKDGQS